MSTNAICAPAWEMASVVAMKVCGTVITISPGLTPAPMNANRGEFFLKLLNHRSANESGVAERFLRYRQKFRFEFLVWCNQIQKRYFCWIGHVYFFSSSTNLKNFAGLPATIAFAGTSFVTTLPAPTIAFSPIVRLHKIVEPEPMDAPLHTFVFSTFQSASV